MCTVRYFVLFTYSVLPGRKVFVIVVSFLSLNKPRSNKYFTIENKLNEILVEMHLNETEYGSLLTFFCQEFLFVGVNYKVKQDSAGKCRLSLVS